MKKLSIFKKIIILFLILFIGIFSYFYSLYSNIRNNIYEATPKENEIEVKIKGNMEQKTEHAEEEESNFQYQKGITNILFIGLDAREVNENSRSDSMIIATIDENNKKLKFTSIMRDTYVNIPGHGQQKINTAFALGGAQLLLKTLESNLNIKIEKYMVVNFWGFQDIVDSLGGLDISIKDYEVDEINKYIGEVNEKKSPRIIKSGLQHLDGQQVLAYTRIRKVGDGSFERNRRQREVMMLLSERILAMNFWNYPSMVSKISNYIKTNIEPMTIINYGYTVSKIKPMTIEQLQIPVSELCEGGNYKGSWVIIMDKKQNSNILNNFIYNDKIIDKKDYDYNAFKNIISQYKNYDKKASNKSAKKIIKREDNMNKAPQRNNDKLQHNDEEHDDYDLSEE
ncbi:LCP family protein [Desnuesiella massiliensis]|uniref:LCP family protein n=1 Tax=Desnuesiella massiliensis TaxID=1650662 RepID=UPI0006E31605|nr:LCP family protein [Desnuesiella massiliensis]